MEDLGRTPDSRLGEDTRGIGKDGSPVIGARKTRESDRPGRTNPGSAATAPDELTWKEEPEPTDNKDEGVVVPIPILPRS